MRNLSFHISVHALALLVIIFSAFGSRIGDEHEHILDTSTESKETGIDKTITTLAWDVLASIASKVGSKATDFAKKELPSALAGKEMFPMMNRAIGLTAVEEDVEIRPCGTDRHAAKKGCRKCIAYFTTQSRPRRNGETADELEDKLVCAVPSAYGILGPGDFSGYRQQDWYESCCREKPPSARAFAGRKPALRIDWGVAPSSSSWKAIKAFEENMWVIAPYWSVFVDSGVEVNGNPVYTTVDGRVNIFVKIDGVRRGPDSIKWGIAWSSQAEESFYGSHVGEFVEHQTDLLDGVLDGTRALDREIHLGAWHNLYFDDYAVEPSAQQKAAYSKDMAQYVQGMVNPPTGLQDGAGVWYSFWTGRTEIMRCTGKITIL